jgi:DNA-binding protein H-NS
VTATYAELKKQIAELEQAAHAARKAETAEAISKIQSIMSDYGLTIADIDSKAKLKGTSNYREIGSRRDADIGR